MRIISERPWSYVLFDADAGFLQPSPPRVSARGERGRAPPRWGERDRSGSPRSRRGHVTWSAGSGAENREKLESMAMNAAGAPVGSPSSTSSTQREASAFLVWGGAIILLAHGVDLLHAGRPNWPALSIRVAWFGLLLGQAAALRRARPSVLRATTAAAIFGSAVLDLAIVMATGCAGSPLLWFTPVLATVLPFMGFEMIAIGIAGSAALVAGTGLILLADGAPAGALVALANGGGGGIACGWLLARAFERARRTEEARRVELATALAEIKTLTGMLPVCAWCHRVRTDAGYWQQIEAYVSQHTDATFTHGLCQDCFEEHYGDEPGEEDGPARERSR